MSFLNLNSVSFSYGKEPVLRDISLNLKQGNILSIIGPSGCGKSTLLRVILGLERSQNGSIHLDGKLLSNNVKHVATQERNIGIVFQDYHLFPHMSVWKNVIFGLNKGESKDKARTLMRLMGIEDLMERMPGELSGGQQQRVALARTLVCEPKLLLMDEPFSSLDNSLRMELRHELKESIQQLNITSILVLHDIDDVMAIADEVLLMDKGSLVQKGAVLELLNHPKTPMASKFFGKNNVHEIRNLAPEMVHKLNIPMSAKFLSIPRDAFEISTENDDIPAFLVDKYFDGNVYVLRFKIGDLMYQMHSDELPESEFKLNINTNKILFFNG